jgi:hypothetical protein
VQWTQRSACLAVRQIMTSTTGDAQASVLKDVIASSGLGAKLGAITTDGAADIGLAVGILRSAQPDLSHIHCACHRLNLVLDDAFKVRSTQCCAHAVCADC